MTADLETDTDADDDYDDPFEINGASRFVFPSDFDDEYEFFIGVTGVAWPGSVHRINDDIAYNLGEEDGDIDADIISLDLVGSFGNVQMLAGTPAAEGDAVLVSTDDGEKWDDMDKDPFGVGDTYVVMDEDFADNGTAWAAVSGANGGVAETTNSAEHFNQISMINVNIDAVEAIDFADGNMLMITMDATSTDESVWMEKSDWERVFIFDEANATLDLIAVSPESADVIYIGNSDINGEINDAQQIFRTTNNGNEWDDLGVLPGNLFSWVVIDDSTVIAGGNEEVFITENYGRRQWDDEDIDSAGNIVHLVLSPNFSSDETILAGDDNGSIAISEDMGDTWDVVDKADVLGTAANTYVAFDPGYADNMTIYAASGATVERCIIDSGDDWEDQSWKDFDKAIALGTLGAASGIAVAADGSLYVADSTAYANATEDGAVIRSYQPTKSDETEAHWAWLGGDDLEGDLAGGETFGMLYINGNELWTIDTGTADVWKYEDHLTAPVALGSPGDGTGLGKTTEVTLRWDEPTGTDLEYDLQVSSDPSFDFDVVVDEDNIDDDFFFADGLEDGKTYYWRVRVTEPLRSNWSAKWSFTTLLSTPAQHEAQPANGAQNVSIMPAFGWYENDNATGYDFELARDAAFHDAVDITVTTINSYSTDVALEYSSVYYWRVRALKDSTVISGWRTNVFTTMAAPVEPTPPVTIEPTPPAPTVPAPQVIIPPAVTPGWVWAIIGIGAALVIAVIVLIIRTRRVM
jgi:hypothetical protein